MKASAPAEMKSHTEALLTERRDPVGVGGRLRTRSYDPLKGFFDESEGPVVVERALERVIAAHAPLCIG